MRVQKKGSCGPKTLPLALLAAITLPIATAVQATVPQSKWFCLNKDADVEATKVTECGNTCPSTVKTDAFFGKLEELKIDGWYIFGDATRAIYKSPLKNHSPVKFTKAVGVGRSWLSPDGKWLFYQKVATTGSIGSLCIVKTDDSEGFDLGIRAYKSSWYYSSPYEDPFKNIYEIGWIDSSKVDAYAVRIDLSGQPKVLKETKRKIASGLPSCDDGFSVSKDHFYWDERLASWSEFGYTAMKNSTPSPSIIYTIPDGGKGTATKTHAYRVYCPYNCSASFDQTGTLAMANYGRCYADCIHENHKGFCIIPVKNYNDPKISIFQWLLEDSRSSVNWAPPFVDGVDTRKGLWTFQQFTSWTWANDGKHAIGVYQKDADRRLWLVEWMSNTWTPLTGNIPSAGGPLVYITSRPLGIMQTGDGSLFRFAKEQSGVRANGLAAWRDLLGRGSASPTGSGVHVAVSSGAKAPRSGTVLFRE